MKARDVPPVFIRREVVIERTTFPPLGNKVSVIVRIPVDRVSDQDVQQKVRVFSVAEGSRSPPLTISVRGELVVR